MPRKAELVIEFHISFKRKFRRIYRFGNVLTCRLVVIVEFSEITARNGSGLGDFHELSRFFVKVVRTLDAELHQSRTFVRVEVETEAQIERDIRIFQDFEIFVCVVLVEIFGALVGKTCGYTHNGDIRVETASESEEYAELELAEVETVVERDSYTALDIGVFKIDIDAVCHLVFVG